jgi:hypothetical protein
MTDNYDFDKSSAVIQDIGAYSPYIDKQSTNYINDLNGGVYSSNQSLVQFDLSSIFNSSRWTNTNDHFIAIPISMVAACSVGATAPSLAHPKAGWALQTLKSGFHQLIHSADLSINGITVSDTQPFLGTFTHIRLLSELSQNDLKSLGSQLGVSELDTVNSTVWGGTGAGTTNGNGLTNNLVFGTTTQETASSGVQGSGLCNRALNARALKNIDTSKSNIVTNVISGAAIRSEYKPSYQVFPLDAAEADARYGVITDTAIIRLRDIIDCMGNIGLVKRFGAGTMLRLYVNTGYLNIDVNGTAATHNGLTVGYKFTVANSTFQNTCPFTINSLRATAALGGLPDTTTRITAGLFIGKILSTPGIDLSAATTASHSMTSCRLYYSSIALEPEKALSYSRSNQAKKIVYKNYYFNQINAVGGGQTYSALIQSGIRNPFALIIVPYISGATDRNFYQWQSPFDQAPATGSPCIIDQIQVQLGGQQVLSNPLNYAFEDFLTQFVHCEALTSSDFGVSCGLVNREYWDANRCYYINLSRGTRADMITPRNIVLTFRNNSVVSVDLKVFTVYLDEFTLNVDNGMITR